MTTAVSLRMWRVYRELRRIGLRNVRRAYQKSRAETALLSIVFLTVVVLEYGGIFILVTERHTADANIKTASDALIQLLTTETSSCWWVSGCFCCPGDTPEARLSP